MNKKYIVFGSNISLAPKDNTAPTYSFREAKAVVLKDLNSYLVGCNRAIKRLEQTTSKDITPYRGWKYYENI